MLRGIIQKFNRSQTAYKDLRYFVKTFIITLGSHWRRNQEVSAWFLYKVTADLYHIIAKLSIEKVLSQCNYQMQCQERRILFVYLVVHLDYCYFVRVVKLSRWFRKFHVISAKWWLSQSVYQLRSCGPDNCKIKKWD